MKWLDCSSPLYCDGQVCVRVCKKRCWLIKEQSALKLWHPSPDRREEEEIKQQLSHLAAPTHPQVRLSVFVVCSELRESVMTRGEARFAQRKQQMEMEAVMSPPGSRRWCLSEVTHFYSCHLSRPNTNWCHYYFYCKTTSTELQWIIQPTAELTTASKRPPSRIYSRSCSGHHIQHRIYLHADDNFFSNCNAQFNNCRALFKSVSDANKTTFMLQEKHTTDIFQDRRS